MAIDRSLRRKMTFLAHGRKSVFVKKPEERMRHIYMKAFLWSLYLPLYTDLRIEVDIGARYKPDVVALGSNNTPVFWGEAGLVKTRKLEGLVVHYPHTHFAFAKWNTPLAALEALVARASAKCRRTAAVDLISFPPDSPGRFISDRGRITVLLADLAWRRVPPSGSPERPY